MEVPLKKTILPLDSSFHVKGKTKPDFTVGDFLQWAYSDLQDNTNRGVLAEYLVARALGIELTIREGWANYDLQMQDGTKIEVKASGLLQSWAQSKPSKLEFGRLKGLAWDAIKGFGPEQTYRADVYVFAVQKAESHTQYDPLDIGQWEFLVVPGKEMEKLNQKTVTYSSLKKLVPQAVDFAGLKNAVMTAKA